jgi:hypothetical protein
MTKIGEPVQAQANTAPITAPGAEAVSPAITQAIDTPAPTEKKRQTRKPDLFSRKARNVASHLLTMSVPFDYTREESIALAKVSHILQKAEPLVLMDCLRWSFDQYMQSSFPQHIAAYDALPAEQQTAKLPKATTTRSRSLASKIVGMAPDDIRALLQKKRDAALKMQAEADALLASYMEQANAEAIAA